MALDTTTPRSRRALLAAAFGGLAAMAAQAIGRPQPVEAGTGSVMLGAVNDSADTTVVQNSTDDSPVFRSVSTVGGSAIVAKSPGYAIEARGGGVSVYAVTSSGFGVHSSSLSGTGVQAVSNRGTGLFAFSSRGDALRANSESGTAVNAESLTGDGLRASTHEGYALRTFGRVRFKGSSGSATIAAGRRSVTVTNNMAAVLMTRGAVILATIIGGNPGGSTTVQRVSKDLSVDTFTIHLTARAANDVRVGWFVIS
jgi:hypothetical protein